MAEGVTKQEVREAVDFIKALKNEGGKPMTEDWKDYKLGELKEALDKTQRSYENVQKELDTLKESYKVQKNEVDGLRGKPLLTSEHKKALEELEGFRSGINHFTPGQMVKIIEGCPDCQERLAKDDVRRLMKLVNIHEAPTSIKISAKDLRKLRG